MILEKDPICFNHNLETVERLQKEVRRGANYKRSLGLLKKSKDIAPHIQTKSGISLGHGDFGFISINETALGYPIPYSSLDEIIYGLLIVLFMLFEPLGLYGIWINIRNYWKGWPFSY